MKNSVQPVPLTLGEMIRTERLKHGLTQKELAELAKVNFTTINRIERSGTSPKAMRSSVLEGLSKALHVPSEILKKMSKGQTVSFEISKICPSCWTPGTAPDSRWSAIDAVYCMRCASVLTSDCACGEPIVVKGRFCPQCGKSYKKSCK